MAYTKVIQIEPGRSLSCGYLLGLPPKKISKKTATGACSGVYFLWGAVKRPKLIGIAKAGSSELNGCRGDRLK